MANVRSTSRTVQQSSAAEVQAVTYQATVVGLPKAGSEKTKINGAVSVQMQVMFLDGPAKGKVVFATRTTKNAEGEEKSIPPVGAEVTIYHTQVPSNRPEDNGKLVNFFDIGTGAITDQDTLNDIFGDINAQEDDI